MTRIDPNAFAQNYLAGAQLGTQQFRIVDEMQQRQLAQQREQEQLQRTRMILKSVLQQSAAPAMTGVPEQGMGPMPDSGGFAGAIEQNNKDVEELSAMIDVAGPESLRYISGLVDDRRKVSKALADARHAWDRGIAGHIDPKRHQDFAAFAQLFAAEQDPERKMARLDEFYQQQEARAKAEQANKDWEHKQGVMQAGREVLQQGSQAFQASRDKAKAAEFQAKVARTSQEYQNTRGWSKAKADSHAYLVLSQAENEPASLSDDPRKNTDSLIKQRDQLMKMSKDGDLPTEFGQRPDVKARIAELDVMILDAMRGGSRQTRPGWRFVTTRPGGMGADFVFAGPSGEQVVAAPQGIPDDLRGLVGGGGGLSQTTSTTPAPGAPSGGDPMEAARAALGNNATVEQIDQWMEANGL